MNNNNNAYQNEFSNVSGVAVNRFVAKVFMWMFAGLFVTGVIASLTASNVSLLLDIVSNRFLFFGLIIGELVLVYVISAKVMDLPFELTVFLFFLYSFINGLTLSVIFAAYTSGSIAGTFFVAAMVFGGMGVYGYFTKKDLSGLKTFLFSALIGLIVASFINILILKSSGVDFLISIVGVLLFSAITAYDMQMIKSYSNIQDEAVKNKLAVSCALKVYLDFINLFIYMLRLFGKRR